MKVKKKALMGIVGLFSAITLAFTGGVTEVNAYYEGMQFKENYNTDALKAFGITDDYFHSYFDMTRLIVTSDMNSAERNQLAKDGLMMFAWEGIQSHSLPSQVNNGITIHYVDGDFRIVGSGGSSAIDNLFLAFVQDLGGNGHIDKVVEKEHRTPTQPRILVNGRNVELYVPYVYYNKNERKYVEKQLENKLKVLTGADFNVTFKSSKKSSVDKYDKKYGVHVVKERNGVYGGAYDNSNLLNFLCDRHLEFTMDFNETARYENGNYMSYPDYYIVHDYKLYEFLDEWAYKWHGGSNAYTQRIILGNIVWNLFNSARVTRLVFEDFTLTLRAGKYLDIEPSEQYLSPLYNEGVQN